MKVVAILLCFIVAVYCETCTSNRRCTQTTCTDSSHHVVCYLGQCTCSGRTGHTCADVADCSSEHCRFGRSHCYDGHCHCLPGAGK
nr:serine protease inhibitor [Mytilus galloprovincialis]